MSGILDFFEKVLSFFEKEAPIAATIMAAIPGLQLPAAGVALLSSVPKLCQTAEQLLGAGNGDQKYDLVTTMVNAGVMSLQKLFPADAQKYSQLALAVPLAIEQTIANVKLAQSQATPVQ